MWNDKKLLLMTPLHKAKTQCMNQKGKTMSLLFVSSPPLSDIPQRKPSGSAFSPFLGKRHMFTDKVKDRSGSRCLFNGYFTTSDEVQPNPGSSWKQTQVCADVIFTAVLAVSNNT